MPKGVKRKASVESNTSVENNTEKTNSVGTVPETGSEPTTPPPPGKKNNVVTLSHIHIIEILEWLPLTQANRLETWLQIEERWNFNVTGADAVKATILAIIFNWELVENYFLTSDFSPKFWEECSWDHLENTIMTWPSASMKQYLKHSLLKLANNINNMPDPETFFSSHNMPSTSTSYTAAPTPTAAAGAEFGMPSQPTMSLEETLKIDASVANSLQRTGKMYCSIQSVVDGSDVTTKWVTPILDHVVDINIYNRSDVLGMNSQHWWKVKQTRLWMTFSKQSPIQHYINRIKEETMKSLPPQKDRETKSKKRSSN